MSSEIVPRPRDDDRGYVFNIQRFSIEDGPGIRTTVFTKGCPLRCIWCHNPEGLVREPQLMWFDVRCIGARDCLEACPRGALTLTPGGMEIDRTLCDACGVCQDACPAGALEVVGKSYNAREVFEEVLRDEAFYRNSGGGVTVSGGEPTMQPDFVAKLLELCQNAGIHTALDTCGYCNPGVLERLLGLSDMVLLDLKTLDESKHREYTGVPLRPILENTDVIDARGKPVWIRTPVIPGCTDSIENIGELSAYVAGLGNVERYDLLAFNNTCGPKYRRLDLQWQLDARPLIEKKRMEELAGIARDAGARNVNWSGMTRRED